MNTTAEALAKQGANLLDDISVLLGDPKPLRNMNLPYDSVVFIGPHYSFPKLSLAETRLQSRLRENYSHFIVIARALLRKLPEARLGEIDDWDKTIVDIIEQNHVWHATSEETMTAAKRAVNAILAAISSLYDPSEGSVVIVPDTNALIQTPVITTWRFNDFPEFEMLVIPTVLAELDDLKIRHRNPAVRKKAQSIIRQLKEYRRRGPLSDGIVVATNRIRLRSIALEPHVKHALPWLDEDSRDDRILASFVEVMRTHPRSVVALVTGDINLQNKAEFAGIPYLEPPEPPPRRTAKPRPES